MNLEQSLLHGNKEPLGESANKNVALNRERCSVKTQFGEIYLTSLQHTWILF